MPIVANKTNNRMSNAFSVASISSFGQKIRVNPSENHKVNNRMSTAFSMTSSQQFNKAYLGKGGDKASEFTDFNPNRVSQLTEEQEIDEINSFLLAAEGDDDTMSDSRSAINLAPFSKDLGNRFSTIDPDQRGSFFVANSVALSVVSNA